jgi:hypothetical protein
MTSTITTAAIRHRLGVTADPTAVYERLATVDGLQRWWTTDVRGTSAVGETISFFFGGADRSCAMEVRELTPGTRVVWRCVGGPEEWVGTDFTFELHRDPGADETALLFTNDGWREQGEFMHHCSTKWASFLIGLKQDVETGDGRPYPNDVKLSGWD